MDIVPVHVQLGFRRRARRIAASRTQRFIRSPHVSHPFTYLTLPEAEYLLIPIYSATSTRLQPKLLTPSTTATTQ
jgi:hypothetical protein